MRIGGGEARRSLVFDYGLAYYRQSRARMSARRKMAARRVGKAGVFVAERPRQDRRLGAYIIMESSE